MYDTALVAYHTCVIRSTRYDYSLLHFFPPAILNNNVPLFLVFVLVLVIFYLFFLKQTRKRAGEADMQVEDAIKDDMRQTYYQGYIESMVTAVSHFSGGGGHWYWC